MVGKYDGKSGFVGMGVFRLWAFVRKWDNWEKVSKMLAMGEYL